MEKRHEEHRQELVASKEQLEQILENIAEGIFIISRDGRIRYANRAAAKIYGRTRSDIVGRSFDDPIWVETTVDGKPYPAKKRPFMQAVKTGRQVYGVELVIGRPDGTRPIISFNALPLRDKTGALTGIVETFSDITERKRSEEVLARYRLLFERTKDIILFMRRDGRIVDANPAAVAAYGYSREELLSMRIHDLRAPETLPLRPSQMEQADTTGILFETIHRRKDGSTFPVEVNSTGTVIGDEWLLLSIIRDITARKRTEEALRESELRFREMLEEVELLAIIVDIEGKVTFVNDYLVRLTGWEREDLLGKPFERFIAPENRESVRRIFVESIAKGDVLPRYETDIITAWGETRTVSFANVLLRDARGNITGTANIGQDITDQKRISEEIRESRKQVLDILESITDGFFALDNDWRFTYVNQKAAQLVGKRKEELLFRNMWDVLPQLVGTDFDREYRRAKEQMVPVSFEAFYSPLGRWFEVHVYPYENGLSVYLSDITERRQAEQALRESEERYRRLVELSPDPVVVHSDGVIVYVNPATVKLLNAESPEELIGRPVLSFVPQEFRDIVIERIKQMQQGKPVGYIEEQFIRVDGGRVDVETAATPIIYEGKPSIMVVGRDITERKRAEAELLQARQLSDALNSINTAINSTLDFNEIMHRALVGAAKAIGAERAGILLREDGNWVARYVYGYPKELIGTRLAEAEAPVTTLSAQTKSTVVVNDVYNDPRVNRETMKRFGIRSFLTVPLLIRGTVIGAIDFSYHSAPVGFTEAQVDFATKLGVSLSSTLENAKLFKELEEKSKE